MKKMKILYVNQLFKQKAGTELIAINTYEIFKKRGHDVYFFASKSESYYEKEYEYLNLFPQGVNNTIEYLKYPLKYYWNFEAAKNLENMIKLVKPDIVHFHSFISPSVLAVCKQRNIPAVMTLHMMPSQCPSTIFLYKNKNICSNFKCKNGNYWNCILNRCANDSIERSVRKSLLSYILDKTNAYSAISYFICPSNALKNYVNQTNICKEKNRIITINNFLSDNELNTVPNYSNKGYFLYIGRLSKEKGLDYLLKAMKDLPRNIELHIVGAGQEEENLKRFAKDNNLKNVHFLGFKNREEIKEEYQNCIATILPCNWFENFPTTNMESFINGKPVIASNIGGIPEQVEHNKTGLQFEPTNIEQLKECILKYWSNLQLVIEHGKNAYCKAKEQYTTARYYNELLDVYKKALNQGTKYEIKS